MKKSLLLFIIIFILAACEVNEPEIPPEVSFIEPVNETFIFNHDGVDRVYDLYIPEDTPEGSPLMLMLHGFTSTKEIIRSESNMDMYANREKFAVIYPQGLESNSTFLGITIQQTHWNAGLTLSDVDDIGFLTALTTYLQDTYALSSENTFVSGFSNGGFMAYTLACEASDVFKGIGVVSGLMSGETYETCEPENPVDIIHIHGLADQVVPADGTMFAPGGWGGAPEVPLMLEKWMVFNQVEITQTNRLLDTITEVKASSDTNNHRIHYYLIDDFDHTWPLSPNPNELGMDPLIDASETIVEFLILRDQE